MDYLEIKINVPSELEELIIAELSVIGYDSFNQSDEGLLAYITADLYNESELKETLLKYDLGHIIPEVGELENKNWNEEWEKNFDPVFIDDQCVIKASFHKIEQAFPYEILIDPKMSFGTGHHETTCLMIKNQLSIPHDGKTICDVGCGTGVLAIMAKLLNAKTIHACDIDEWSYNNTLENFACNDLTTYELTHGIFATHTEKHNVQYDILLANINKNVLLQEMELYVKFLAKNGYLVLSGFYNSDIEDIQSEAFDQGLTLHTSNEKNSWASLVFIKK